MLGEALDDFDQHSISVNSATNTHRVSGTQGNSVTIANTQTHTFATPIHNWYTEMECHAWQHGLQLQSPGVQHTGNCSFHEPTATADLDSLNGNSIANTQKRTTTIASTNWIDKMEFHALQHGLQPQSPGA